MTHEAAQALSREGQGLGCAASPAMGVRGCVGREATDALPSRGAFSRNNCTALWGRTNYNFSLSTWDFQALLTRSFSPCI